MSSQKAWVFILGAGLLLTLVITPTGHTAISSRWNYNEHLFPIFLDQCGSCHNDGGVAPMSLLTYQDAFPWTQSIREEILGLRMPPWQAEDGFGRFQNGHALSAVQMDMILEWSSGGYPQGPRDQVPPVPEIINEWRLGDPSIALEMPEAFTIAAGTSSTIRYFVLPVETTENQFIRAVDFHPGARSIVRSASVFIDSSGSAQMLDDADPGLGFGENPDYAFPAAPPVAVWVPGQAPIVTDDMGFALPSDATIVLRVQYKKTWITEGQEFSDQSSLGLYFSDRDDVAEISSLLVNSPATVSGREVTFTHEVDADIRLLGLLPEVDIGSSEIQVQAVKPDGTRVPMLWLREPDSGWVTRFWFASPVDLVAGSQLEFTAILEPAAEYTPSASLLGSDLTHPIRVSIDYVLGSRTGN